MPIVPLLLDIDRIDTLAARLTGYRRILLQGAMGAGKTTLAIKLLHSLGGQTGRRLLLELDPGTPPFGIPGAISLSELANGRFGTIGLQALCTLDAGRFRLPLILAAGRLMKKVNNDDILVIDPPGLVRGVGGAEMLMALAESLAVDAIVALRRDDHPLPLDQELAAMPFTVLQIPSSPAAKPVARLEQLGHRLRLWDDFLAAGGELTVSLDHTPILGTPPPREATEAWAGRQAALLSDEGETVRMGEVVRLQEGGLTLRMGPGNGEAPAAILIRDAGRTLRGRLETVQRPAPPTAASPREPLEMIAPIVSPRPGRTPVSSNLGQAWATLVGGVFGDPLVHVRLRRNRRSFFFDLGEPSRLAARVAHQVSAIFLSHAHIDHIGGLTWFLRSRLGPFGPCRIFGPAETIRRIESFLDAITWDRIDDRGPVFEVHEIEEDRMRSARLQPGRTRIELPEKTLRDGVVLAEESFTIKAAVCDHLIPSIAYALLFHQEINVRRERLAAAKLPPGPWLATLKRCIAADTLESEIVLPNGNTEQAGVLAKDLTIVKPGKKLVYAADLADTPENRRKLVNLARAAHTFFCETAFTARDKDKALASQHLTTLAAVQIAREAGVQRLAPFHFSKRYEHDYRQVYEEIRAAAGNMHVLGAH